VNVPHISPAQIKGFRFNLPPLEVQSRIVSVLSAYDELVNGNMRRIQILEEMVHAIHREWFVKFRYPGHEDVPLVDSELGPIPKGWEASRLGDRFEVWVGSTPSRKRPDFWTNGTIPWVNSSAINLLRVIEGTALISEEAFASTSTKLMPSGTTLVAVTGATLGQVSRLEIAACGSQNVCGVFDPKDQYREFIYLTLSNQIKEIANQATGGAQQHINRRIVTETPVILPPTDIIQICQEIVRPMFEMIAVLLRINKNLSIMRDLLLPRLISWEIDVSDLDIEVGDAAA
jgi:type I restriction enzyme S subunit